MRYSDAMARSAILGIVALSIVACGGGGGGGSSNVPNPLAGSYTGTFSRVPNAGTTGTGTCISTISADGTLVAFLDAGSSLVAKVDINGHVTNATYRAPGSAPGSVVINPVTATLTLSNGKPAVLTFNAYIEGPEIDGAAYTVTYA